MFKVPWDRHYLKISFYVVFTLTVIFVLGMIILNFMSILGAIGDVLSVIAGALTPVFIAFVIAYLLDGLVEFFQKHYDSFMQKDRKNSKVLKFFNKKFNIRFNSKNKGKKTKALEKRKSRIAGTALTYIAIILILVFAVKMTTDSIGKNADVSMFAATINSYVNAFSDIFNSLKEQLDEWGLLEQTNDYIDQFIGQITSFVQSIGVNLASFVTKAGSGIINFILALTIAFYFLKDKARILESINHILKSFLTDKMNRTIYALGEDINLIFSGYIRGQLTDAFIMSILVSAAMYFVGVKFAIIIGVISGISNIIPYFGAIIAFVLSIGISLLAGDPIKALYAAIIIIVLQQIDGNFIVPKVVGEKVELHPAIVLIALAVAGYMFGIVGMVFAVPVVAILKMFFVRMLRRKERRSY